MKQSRFVKKTSDLYFTYKLSLAGTPLTPMDDKDPGNKEDAKISFARNTQSKNHKEIEGSYHNSKPVKSGKPSHWGGGGLGFYLVFPNLEVGKWFLLGGVSKSTR